MVGMAIGTATYYVDGVNGSDSNAGTDAAPFASITMALQQSDTAYVIVEPGIYTEQITTQGGNYQFPFNTAIADSDKIILIARGTVIIDGEDARACLKNGSTTLGGAANTILSLIFIGFIFRDPVDEKFIDLTLDTVDQPSQHYLGFFNCTFYIQGSSASTGEVLNLAAAPQNENNKIEACFTQCTFKRFEQLLTFGGTPNGWQDICFRECIIDLNDATEVFGAYTGATVTQTNNAFDSTKSALTPAVDINTTAPTYVDETYGTSEDLGLDRTNASNQTNYLASGRNLQDIGSYWHSSHGANYYWTEGTGGSAAGTFTSALNLWAAVAGSGYIYSGTGWKSDSDNYENGTTQGPAALISGNDYAVMDTITQPAQTSAAWLSPVWKHTVANGRTATIKHVSWSANEDTAPASGDKDVIDANSGATRTVQWRSSTTAFDQDDATPSWNTNDRDDVIGTTHTSTFYTQLRIILRHDGD